MLFEIIRQQVSVVPSRMLKDKWTISTDEDMKKQKPKFYLLEKHEHIWEVPDGYQVVDVDPEVEMWLDTQPQKMWSMSIGMPFGVYYVSDELFTLLMLRWS